MTGSEDEFFIGLLIGGGVAFACIMVLIGLSFVAIGMRNKVKKSQIIKQIQDEQKTRSNGRH